MELYEQNYISIKGKIYIYDLEINPDNSNDYRYHINRINKFFDLVMDQNEPLKRIKVISKDSNDWGVDGFLCPCYKFCESIIRGFPLYLPTFIVNKIEKEEESILVAKGNRILFRFTLLEKPNKI